ncbi:DUF3293 domain-containing protein [Deinococcus piscis]|uniref:DUF3293 domain-containing protein n=1 Tax=Deinococcus piscis TaxID=394230 RepID=UPI00167527E1
MPGIQLGSRRARRDNEQRQRALEAELRRLGQHFRAGHNGEGEWQEPTFILQDIGPGELARLGRDFGQAAVLCGSGTRAALLWLDGGRAVQAERRWLVCLPPEPRAFK